MEFTIEGDVEVRHGMERPELKTRVVIPTWSDVLLLFGKKPINIFRTRRRGWFIYSSSMYE